MHVKKWVLAGAFALGLGAMPTGWTASARADREDPVRVREAPQGVREVLDREVGRKGEVVQLSFVSRDNAEFYRAVVREPDGDVKMIRMTAAGRILEKDVTEAERRWESRWREEHVRPADVRRVEVRPDEVRRGEVRPDDIRRDLEGWSVDREDVPGRAWRTIDREVGRGRVDTIREVYYHGLTLYRVEVRARDGDRTIFIGPDGTFYGDREDLVGGLREVALDDVPRPVRETFRREGDTGRLRTVFTSRRGGVRFYTAVIDSRRGSNWVTCDEDGRVSTNVEARP